MEIGKVFSQVGERFISKEERRGEGRAGEGREGGGDATTK